MINRAADTRCDHTSHPRLKDSSAVPQDVFDTLPGMLWFFTRTYQNAQAFNHLEAGRWVHTSTESFAEQTRRLALGLVAMGVKPGQTVGILADPSPWWLMVDMAIIAAGGVSVPLFPHGSETNLKFKLQDAGPQWVFVSDRASARSLEPYQGGGDLRVILRGDGGDGADRGRVIGDRDLMKMGDELSTRQPTLFRCLCEQARPNDTATIIYTSSSTGMPKGVMLTHRNFVSQIHAAAQWFHMDCTTDRALSLLPLAHVFERMVVYFCLSRGVSIWFADDPKNLGGLIRQVSPTCMTVVPRVLEKVYAAMVTRIEASGLIRRRIGRWAVNHARGHGDGNGSLRRGGGRWVRQRLFEGMRQALGGKLRVVICGGAPLSPWLCRFFCYIGVPIYQGYGLTEASPVITVNCPGHNRIGTVGRPLPGVEVTLSEQGEVLARGPNIMAGYHNNPQATRQAIDDRDWLHTGDLGRIDSDGYLAVTGRIKELCKTSNGKYVSPSQIEKALTASPLIDQAYIVAEGRSFVSCLLFPDMRQVRGVLGVPGPEAMSNERLVGMPELRQRVQELVDQVNDKLDPWERIKQFRLIPDMLSVRSGGLTPTQKVRRHVLAEQYKDLIESIYQDGAPGP